MKNDIIHLNKTPCTCNIISLKKKEERLVSGNGRWTIHLKSTLRGRATRKGMAKFRGWFLPDRDRRIGRGETNENDVSLNCRRYFRRTIRTIAFVNGTTGEGIRRSVELISSSDVQARDQLFLCAT